MQSNSIFQGDIMESKRLNQFPGRLLPLALMLMLAVAATLSACGGGEPEPAPEEPATEEPAQEPSTEEPAEEEEPAGGESTGEEPAAEETPAEEGAGEETPVEEAESGDQTAAPSGDFTGVRGVAVFEGDPPRRRAIQMSADPGCEALHDKPVGTENVLVTSDGQIKNVFVYVKNGGALGDFSPPETAEKLDQVGCKYTPHLLGVQANQPIDIINSDPLMHNIHGLAKVNSEFNFGQPTPGTRQHIFRRAEKEITIKCDIHPWMAAYVFVLDHPFFAITGDTGSYSIPDLPAGEHTIVAWHETFGEKEMTVTVPDGAGATADFTFTN